MVVELVTVQLLLIYNLSLWGFRFDLKLIVCRSFLRLPKTWRAALLCYSIDNFYDSPVVISFDSFYSIFKQEYVKIVLFLNSCN